MEPQYTLQELSKEEGDALTKDLQDVLKKHNCEMGVKSTIELLKRVEVTKDIPSPFMPKNGDNSDETEENANSTTA